MAVGVSLGPMFAQSYVEAVRERVIVFDGAFGTFVQGLDLGPDDFGGASLEGCNEMLCLTRPDVIADMHNAFLDVGVDASAAHPQPRSTNRSHSAMVILAPTTSGQSSKRA